MWVLGLGEGRRAGFGAVHEIHPVVDDGDVKGAAWAAGDLLPELEVVLGNQEEVATGAGVGEGLQFFVPLHALNFHVVVRHLPPPPPPPSENKALSDVRSAAAASRRKREEETGRLIANRVKRHSSWSKRQQ